MPSPATRRAVLALTIAAALAHGRAVPAAPPPGETLAQRWCAQCHALKPGQPSPDPTAPGFADITAEPSATELSLRVFLRTPHPTMPNFRLQADEIDDLVGYILSLKRR